MAEERPKIGLATIIFDKEFVLLGKRKNSLGNGTWSFPGGHLEKFESFEKCSERELKEETGLILEEDAILVYKNPIAITNDFFKEENEHYITIFMLTRYIQGTPKILEPDKCEKWEWARWKTLQKNYELFLPIQNLIKQNYNPFD